MIEDDILQGIDIHPVVENRVISEKWRILLLSRVVREKGINETVEAFSALRGKYPHAELLITGDETEMDNVKSFVRERSVDALIFEDYVMGEEKFILLSQERGIING